MNHKHLFIIPTLIAAISVGFPDGIGTAYALKNSNSSAKSKGTQPSLLAGCTPGASQTDLDVNNVRARMLTGGDMWWDYAKQVGQYEVPKGSGIMPIYAGALWVGGYDVGGTLRLAGQEYRSGGNDWWPGPLDTIGGAASITPDVCQQYDHHYKINQSEVASFVAGGPATAAITNWPGNGNTSAGQAKFLAPFFDKNGDGVYSPGSGDYPGFDLVQGDYFGGCQISNCIPTDQLFGDQCVWWVINDKGDIHTNTQGNPMGLEVHCQAFSFFTDDEINNMTFINYRIYNRSSLQLDSTFIGIWCDPDLGCATDDFVGCDVARGLGYVYNGTNNDVSCSGELGYGLNPPAMGIDFFRGPITNPTGVPGDGVDNNHNGYMDEPCEQAVMTHFVYFINGAAYPQADPANAKEYYNYMSGSWQDGSHLTYGGNGLGGSTPCNYGFPGNTDHQNEWGTGGKGVAVWSGGGLSNPPIFVPAAPQANWDEVSAGDTPGDRRFVESAGPFRMLPGAVNVVTAGVVWARTTSGGPSASVGLMKLADDKAQKLFDNCFQVLNGPDAPDLTIQELDKKLIIYLSNKPTSNNYQETYSEYDPTISLADKNGNALKCIDTLYHFEGYKVFQLKDGTVSSADLNDASKARMIAQCDVKNGISTIVNYIFDQSIGASVPTPEVAGADNGIFHSFEVKTDVFANGDPMLVNHKTYYFMAVAYGYNQFKPYKQDVAPDSSDNVCPLSSSVKPAFDGQKKPYKQGRRNIMSYSAIPHISSPYTGGTDMQSVYGTQPSITRIEGNGNGGNMLDFTSSTIDAICSSPDSRAKTLTYVAGSGPISVRVVDPLNVPDANSFTLKFDTLGQGTNLGNANWTITNNTTGDSVVSGAYVEYTVVSGTFAKGETVTGSISHATGGIISLGSGKMKISNIVYNSSAYKPFQVGETITGATSGATAILTKYKIRSSDQVINMGDEKLLLKWGLAIMIQQVADVGSANSINNGYLGASMTTNGWLTGLASNSAAKYENWEMSGGSGVYAGIDDKKAYAGIIGGIWSPYRLVNCTDATFVNFANPGDTAKYYTGPGFLTSTMSQPQMKDLCSVNIVFTSNKTKWTRCEVLEMCEDTAFAQNTSGDMLWPRKLDYRRAPSVDKNGRKAGDAGYNSTEGDYISTVGMGWFPGYAVNLETGERLNICFGENSALTGAYNQNGADMIWNPTSAKTGKVPWQTLNGPVNGGEHYIYVFGHNKTTDGGTPTPNDLINVPRYDAGKFIDSILKSAGGQPNNAIKREIYRDAMWVNIPMLVTGHSLLESDVTVRLRVARPYKVGYSSAFHQDGTTIIYDDTASVAFGQNRNLPMYKFGTDGIATKTEQHDVAVSALDLINVVPNPYYAYSAYETSAIDNRIKITNLPEQCTVSIYNLSGTLIRVLKNGEDITNLTPKGSNDPKAWHDRSLDWDLKNSANTPIASGIYIIHVEVPGVGEKIIKWFGIMRPIDLDTY